MEITIFNVYSILLNDIDNFNMFHIYFIGFGCLSISVGRLIMKSRVLGRYTRFYDPVPTYLSNQLLTYLLS